MMVKMSLVLFCPTAPRRWIIRSFSDLIRTGIVVVCSVVVVIDVFVVVVIVVVIDVVFVVVIAVVVVVVVHSLYSLSRGSVRQLALLAPIRLVCEDCALCRLRPLSRMYDAHRTSFF